MIIMNNKENGNLYVNKANMEFVSKEVYELLQNFKKEMIRMESLQDELISENNSVKNDWQGSASDADLGEIDKFRPIFENVKEKNQKHVVALNKIIDRYAYEEKTNIDTVNDNVSAYDFTWQKGA